MTHRCGFRALHERRGAGEPLRLNVTVASDAGGVPISQWIETPSDRVEPSTSGTLTIAFQQLGPRSRAAVGGAAGAECRYFAARAEVQSAEPVLPSALDDRARDNWRPL